MLKTRTTKEYIKEFGFDSHAGLKFDRAKFVRWLGEDFEFLIRDYFQRYNASEIAPDLFFHFVKEIDIKFNAINNKKLGKEIPRELWNVFYAIHIIPKKKELLPALVAKEEAKKKRLDEVVENARAWSKSEYGY